MHEIRTNPYLNAYAASIFCGLCGAISGVFYATKVEDATLKPKYVPLKIQPPTVLYKYSHPKEQGGREVIKPFAR